MKHPHVVGVLLAVAACGGSDGPAEETGTIGEDGGDVGLPGGPTLTILPGAVDADVDITIREADADAPEGALGRLYEFEPSGLVFARPVAISLPVPDGTTEADLYWTELGGTALVPVGGEIVDGQLVAAVDHFSGGYVGPEAAAETVGGTRQLSWASSDGLDIQPVDLSALTVQALIDDGAGYMAIDGVGTAEGGYSIDGVPDGDYWVRLGSTYFRTAARVVDAGELRQGRPDAVVVTMTPTDLVVNATGLNPWQSGDRLEMFSTQAGDWWFDVHMFGTAGLPQVDDTALTGLTLDTRSYPSQLTGYLIDGDAGDQLIVAQLVGRMTTEGTAYSAMNRVLEVPPFRQTDGAASTVSGAFVNVSLDHQLSTSIALADYEIEMGAFAGGTPIDRTLYVLGQAGGIETGVYGATADFIWLPLVGTGSVVATDMSYGTPLAGVWDAYAGLNVVDAVGRTAPGATNATPFYYGLTAVLPLDMVAGPLSPQLTPVRNWTIDGASLDAPQSGVGATPVLAWDAPATGTPDVYDVTVYAIAADGADTTQTVAATLRTSQTSFTLPPGILATGQAYVISVSAVAAGNEFATELGRDHIPVHRASRVSDVIQP